MSSAALGDALDLHASLGSSHAELQQAGGAELLSMIVPLDSLFLQEHPSHAPPLAALPQTCKRLRVALAPPVLEAAVSVSDAHSTVDAADAPHISATDAHSTTDAAAAPHTSAAAETRSTTPEHLSSGSEWDDDMPLERRRARILRTKALPPRADADGGRAASGAKRKHCGGGMESYDNKLIGYSGIQPPLTLSASFHRASGSPTGLPLGKALDTTIDEQLKGPGTKGATLHNTTHNGAWIARGIPIFKGYKGAAHEPHTGPTPGQEALDLLYLLGRIQSKTQDRKGVKSDPLYAALFQGITGAAKDYCIFGAGPGLLPPKADHFMTHKAYNKLWHIAHGNTSRIVSKIYTEGQPLGNLSYQRTNRTQNHTLCGT